MFDIGGILQCLCARPYDEVRYRWEKERGIHIFTVYLGKKKAGGMLTDIYLRTIRPQLGVKIAEDLDEELWGKVNGKT